MGQRVALSREEKERIYQGKLAGKTLAEVAEAVGCSVHSARKWWRVGRDKGQQGLAARRRGRGGSGVLSQFESAMAAKAVELKRAHPRWGGRRVWLALSQDEEVGQLAIPSPSRLAVYFKQHCPQLVRSPKRKPKPPRPLRGQEVHQVWQLDSQEGIRLADGDIATVCSIREPVSGAIIASVAFSTKSEKRWRKLTPDEVRQVIRQGMTEWGTLPDVIVTDNEAGLVGHPADPLFPGWLTLWLWGLGIQHQRIRPGQPTDQAYVERNHRTLADFTASQADLANLTTFQAALNRERHLYNHYFPSRSVRCEGQPPLQAFPNLHQPRRPYDPSHESALFSRQRVLDALAALAFARKASQKGQVRIARVRYHLGSAYAGRSLLVRLDPDQVEWCFTDAQSTAELARHPAEALDFASLTGLPPDPDLLPNQFFQLAFAFFATSQQVRLSQDC